MEIIIHVVPTCVLYGDICHRGELVLSIVEKESANCQRVLVLLHSNFRNKKLYISFSSSTNSTVSEQVVLKNGPGEGHFCK